MAEPQTPPRFCSDLLGLYFIHPECKEEHIVYAFSFDREILEKMIIDNFIEEDRNNYSIKSIVIFTYISLENNDESTKIKLNKLFNSKNARGLIMRQLDYNNIDFPLYGYYRNCEKEKDREGNIGVKEQQVILSIDDKYKKLIKNELISQNPIDIDTFYDEGIMNA